jgi:hypothetical protein
MRGTCDFYDNPRAAANELYKFEEEKQDSFHEAIDASASNVAVEILINRLWSIV